MSMVDKVRQGISRLAREHGGPTALAEKAGVGQPNISRFLSGKTIPRFDTIARLLEMLGAQILFPDEERSSANPGSTRAEAGCSWVLALEGRESIRCRPNLAAYEVGKGQQAMAPTLHPKDVVLVDRDDFRPGPNGSLFLVRTPGAQPEVTVRRVFARRKQGHTLLTFVADNPDRRSFPPTVHTLEDDWQGGLRQAIVGRVVRVWADMTGK